MTAVAMTPGALADDCFPASTRPYRVNEIKAFVWRLADSTQSSPAAVQPGESIHPTTLVAIGCKSAAWGINNADPPVIVGGAAEAFCSSPECDTIDPVYGFAVSLGTPSSAVWLPGNGNGESRAYAVNTESPPLAVGLDLDDEPYEMDCEPDFEPEPIMDAAQSATKE